MLRFQFYSGTCPLSNVRPERCVHFDLSKFCKYFECLIYCILYTFSVEHKLNVNAAMADGNHCLSEWTAMRSSFNRVHCNILICASHKIFLNGWFTIIIIFVSIFPPTSLPISWVVFEAFPKPIQRIWFARFYFSSGIKCSTR